MMRGMKSQLDNSESPARVPRLYFIWDCQVKTELAFIVATILMFVVIGLPLTFLIIAGVRTLTTWGSGYSTALALNLEFLLIAGLFYLASAFRRPKFRSWNPFRIRRLEWLREHPSTSSRFPHRVVELIHHGHQKCAWGLKKHLAKIPPGNCIAIDFTEDEATRARSRSVQAFEPICWEARDSQMLALVEELPALRTEQRRPFLHTSLDDHVARFIRFFPMTLVIFALGKAIVSGQSWISLLQDSRGVIVGLCVLFSIFAFGALVIGRKYYLVPGGLVRVENGLFFRKPRIDLLTPRDTSIVAYGSGGVILVSGGKAKIIETDRNQVAALLIAWLSQARPPTMEELRTLHAPENEPSPRVPHGDATPSG